MLYIRLREIAREQNIGQHRIARKADLDLSVVQRIYRDPHAIITTATLEKLCRALNCTPNDLLAFDPPLAPSSDQAEETPDDQAPA